MTRRAPFASATCLFMAAANVSGPAVDLPVSSRPLSFVLVSFLRDGVAGQMNGVLLGGRPRDPQPGDFNPSCF